MQFNLRVCRRVRVRSHELNEKDCILCSQNLSWTQPNDIFFKPIPGTCQMLILSLELTETKRFSLSGELPSMKCVHHKLQCWAHLPKEQKEHVKRLKYTQSLPSIGSIQVKETLLQLKIQQKEFPFLFKHLYIDR